MAMRLDRASERRLLRAIDYYAPDIVFAPWFQDIHPDEILLLADCLKVTLMKLSKALNQPQYNYIISTAPARYTRQGYWSTIDLDFRWHIEILPRLTLIAGFEVGTGFYINPTPPEESARFLRAADVTHFERELAGLM